jgi:hypothetical protein
MQEHFLTAMDGRNAEVAGANFGRRVPAWPHMAKTEERWLRMAGMPKMQEQISAGGCLRGPT